MKILLWLGGVLVVALGGFYLFNTSFYSKGPTASDSEIRQFERFNLKTDTSQTNIDLFLVVSGGPEKDVIPAINDPRFTTIVNADFADDALGLFVEIDGEQRFYPYAILVWHEIVNDSLGGKDIAVTFCPLCATGIVFDRAVEDDVLQFGVSGLLFESNLLMYDTKTESLWSQARGQAVVGDYTGTSLTYIPMQRITFGELKEKYPNAQVLSADTSYARDYRNNPYSGYEEVEGLAFPVSISDTRFPAKEIMYVVPLDDTSAALQYSAIEDGEEYAFTVSDKELIIARDGDEIFATIEGASLPGYFEMWFSWATHRQDGGVVLEP